MDTQKPKKIAPSGRELSPQVTEGASGGELTVCFGAVLAQDCPFPMPILPGALVSSEQEAWQSWGSTASGRQIGCVPAGSLRLGAAPQATSLPDGGIYGSLLQGNDTGRKKAPLLKGAGTAQP